MSEIKALEYSTIRVPYEVLNKRFRVAQKSIDREVSYVQTAINNVEKILQKDSVAISEMDAAVRALINRLNVLSQKANAGVFDEYETSENITKRVTHLMTSNNESWRKTRIDRLISEYLLRSEYYQTAQLLAESRNIADLINIDVFIKARTVVADLKEHKIESCLEWCHDNKSKLRRIQSTLDLLMREQDFIELVKQNRRKEAVAYARKHLAVSENATWQKEKLPRLMGLLAIYDINKPPAQYTALLDPTRWQGLIIAFWEEFYRVYQLPSQSTFSACLQCGISALKTPQCSSNVLVNKLKVPAARECPICQTDMQNLARTLPYAHVGNSKLVCCLSGETLNENNPAYALPNGMVYSIAALRSLARNEGQIVCPRTGQTYHLEQAMRIYIL